MTDSQEETVDGYMPHRFVRLAFAVHQVCSLYLAFTRQLQRIMLKKHLYLGIIEDALLHDLRSTKIGFANDHIDLLAEPRQIIGLFAGGVSAAYYRYRFLAIEETVACGASTHAAAFVRPLALNAEVFGTRARSNDHCIRFIFLRIFHPYFLRTDRKIYLCNDSGYEFCAEAFCLTAHVVHHRERLYAVRIARKILHLRRGRQLSAKLRTFYQHRLQVSTARIDSSRVSRRTGTYYQTFYSIHIAKISYR